MLDSPQTASFPAQIRLYVHNENQPHTLLLHQDHYELLSQEQTVSSGSLPMRYQLSRHESGCQIKTDLYTLILSQDQCDQYCQYIHRLMLSDPAIKKSIRKIKQFSFSMLRKDLGYILDYFSVMDHDLFTNPAKLIYLHIKICESCPLFECLLDLHRMTMHQIITSYFSELARWEACSDFLNLLHVMGQKIAARLPSGQL